MKKAPDESRQLDRLGRSKLSAEGFLGRDRRQLEEIIADDSQICEKSGTTSAEIADGLDRVFSAAEALFGVPARISNSVSAVHVDAKGAVASPFPGEGRFNKGETIITNTNTNEQFRITRLSIHLIRAHGFFQGVGSTYRVEPDRIALTLGLASKEKTL
jgi:hypothetical protein